MSVGLSAMVSGGTSSYSVAADKIGGVLLQSPLIIEVLDTSLFLPRGFLPIIKTIPHKAFYTDLQIVEQAGRVFIARKVHGSGGTPDGIIMFDLEVVMGIKVVQSIALVFKSNIAFKTADAKSIKGQVKEENTPIPCRVRLFERKAGLLMAEVANR